MYSSYQVSNTSRFSWKITFYWGAFVPTDCHCDLNTVAHHVYSFIHWLSTVCQMDSSSGITDHIMYHAEFQERSGDTTATLYTTACWVPPAKLVTSQSQERFCHLRTKASLVWTSLNAPTVTSLFLLLISYKRGKLLVMKYTTGHEKA